MSDDRWHSIITGLTKHFIYSQTDSFFRKKYRLYKEIKLREDVTISRVFRDPVMPSVQKEKRGISVLDGFLLFQKLGRNLQTGTHHQAVGAPPCMYRKS